jgi:dolichyl-phosphate-mannose--protein O-mannosyl transferase
MPDQKPILEYESLGSARKNQTIKKIASIFLAPVMISMAIAQFWLPHADGKPADRINFTSMCLFALISIPFFLECIRKRR